MPEPHRILLAGEDRTHAHLGGRLFDHAASQVLGAPPTSVDRRLTGLDPMTPFYDVRRSKQDAQERSLRVNPRLFGKPRSPDSIVFTRVGALALDERVHALVLLHDSDNDTAMARDAEQVAEVLRSMDLPAAIGVPHRDAEGWLLADYVPASPRARERLAVARRVLGFDPTREPERLTAQPNDRPTDAKRVCAFIHGDGDTLDGARRAPSRPPTVDELQAMGPDPEKLRRHHHCGAAGFLSALDHVASHLFRPGP